MMMHTTKVEMVKGVTGEESFAIDSEESATPKSGYDLDFSVSKVTQTQRDVLCVHFDIFSTIIIREPAQGELPSNVREDESEIHFLL